MFRLPALRTTGGLVLALACTLGALAPADAPGTPSWQGSPDVTPHAYRWLNDFRPADTYAITVVRGATKKQVLRRLGVVRTELGDLTHQQASEYAQNRMNGWGFPRVIQVTKLGPAVVVFEPWTARGFFKAHRLTRRARLASFITDVDLDTYVKVEKHQTRIRAFDPLFRPPRQGALPQEQGLHFGARHSNVFAQSWAFLERITLIHLSRAWINEPHPTYVFRGRN